MAQRLLLVYKWFFMARLIRITTFLCLLALPFFTPAFAQTPFSPFKALSNQGVAVTALAVDVQSGEVLDQFSPNQLLVPASLSKLFTAAVTLKHWGPNHTFVTRLYAEGNHKDGVLEGDLVLWSEAEPGLVSHHLWSMALQLQQAGVKQVNGDLVVNLSHLGPLTCESKDRCYSEQRSRNAYNAGLAAVGVNYGTWCVKVSPALELGKPALLEFCSLNMNDGVRLVNKTKTVSAQTAVERERVTNLQTSEDTILVSGYIAKNADPVYLYVSAGKVALQAGHLLRQHLSLLGITVTGRVLRSEELLADGGEVLAQVRGDNLATLNRKMLAYSNNFMADMLALNLLAETAESTPLTLAAAGQLVLQQAQGFYGKSAKKEGAEPSIMASGSGLSLESRLSANDIVTLLTGVYQDSAIFPAFLSGLTVPEYSTLGILRGPEIDWKTHVMVKSGSLNEPYTVYGIGGYVRTKTGRWVAFAILLNGTAKHPKLPYADSMQRLRRSVVDLVNLP